MYVYLDIIISLGEVACARPRAAAVGAPRKNYIDERSNIIIIPVRIVVLRVHILYTRIAHVCRT